MHKVETFYKYTTTIVNKRGIVCVLYFYIFNSHNFLWVPCTKYISVEWSNLFAQNVNLLHAENKTHKVRK